MDLDSALLSHQIEVVDLLADRFARVRVITGKVGTELVKKNVEVIETTWVQGKSIRNLYNLYFKALPIILRGDYDVVFFHMTDVQCAFLSPFIRLRRKNQYLWYAHTYNSIYLRWASKWVNNIITSTKGSCPIKSKKVLTIGQSINPRVFSPISFDELNFDKLIHIGRFDKSKKIDHLIHCAKSLRTEFPSIELTIIGSPSDEKVSGWERDVQVQYADSISEGWLFFMRSIPRAEIPNFLRKSGVFIHAYLGSLDKSIIEATMLRVPVVTLNSEYIAEFGSWSNNSTITLQEEFRALRALSRQNLDKELERRLDISKIRHSSLNWLDKLNKILSN